MINRINRIQVFEHQSLIIGRQYDGLLFTEKHFSALVKLNDLFKNQYFTIIHRGVKFTQYVGVVQIDDLCIEILPKLDNSTNDKAQWQSALIEMLRVTKRLSVANVGDANVNKQNVHLLDIFFDLFLTEVDILKRRGLIKKYRFETENTFALKGKIQFAKHITANLAHQERFYNSHLVYDYDHLIHQVFSVALDIIESMSGGNALFAKCKSTRLDFPDVKAINVNIVTFSKIEKSRKTAPYERALEIARLIIMNYAPNVKHGKEKMIALLFDMNVLWEEYVFYRLKSFANEEVKVKSQVSRAFWRGVSIRPDIVIETRNNEMYIIDTKWKNLMAGKPSTHDLRQMYVYNEYWGAIKSLLLYPSVNSSQPHFSNFENKCDGDVTHQCGIGFVSIFNQDSSRLNREIGKEILGFFL